MYKLMSGINVLIRNFLLPNPFAVYENGDLYNWIATIILFPITYGMVSFLYESGSAPTWGSILFLLVYLINSAVLLICSLVNFNLFACVIIGFTYIVIFFSLVRCLNDFGRGY